MCRTSSPRKPSRSTWRAAVSAGLRAGLSRWRAGPIRRAGSAMSPRPYPESTRTRPLLVSMRRTCETTGAVGTRIVPQLRWCTFMADILPDARCRQRRADQPFQWANGVAPNASPSPSATGSGRRDQPAPDPAGHAARHLAGWEDLAMKIAPGIHRIGANSMINAYLVEQAGEVTIIDAGLSGYYGDIDRELAAMGRAPADVSALVLTHGHS